mmetsp:Transcript_13210/g.51686  ORF Transcript_13210/g.51686 Transcript_13210/m.51686 type:complete len:206 (-) Transcript_13210:690-1307(-)
MRGPVSHVGEGAIFLVLHLHRSIRQSLDGRCLEQVVNQLVDYRLANRTAGIRQHLQGLRVRRVVQTKLLASEREQVGDGVQSKLHALVLAVVAEDETRFPGALRQACETTSHGRVTDLHPAEAVSVLGLGTAILLPEVQEGPANAGHGFLPTQNEHAVAAHRVHTAVEQFPLSRITQGFQVVDDPSQELALLPFVPRGEQPPDVL